MVLQVRGRDAFRKSTFEAFINEPKKLTSIAKALYRVKILPKKLYTYYTNYARHEHIRVLVYETWLVYKNFRPNLENIATRAQQHNTDIQLIFGKHDRIIPVNLGRKLSKLLGKKDVLHILPEGHLLINDQTLDYLLAKKIW